LASAAAPLSSVSCPVMKSGAKVSNVSEIKKYHVDRDVDRDVAKDQAKDVAKDQAKLNLFPSASFATCCESM